MNSNSQSLEVWDTKPLCEPCSLWLPYDSQRSWSVKNSALDILNLRCYHSEPEWQGVKYMEFTKVRARDIKRKSSAGGWYLWWLTWRLTLSGGWKEISRGERKKKRGPMSSGELQHSEFGWKKKWKSQRNKPEKWLMREKLKQDYRAKTWSGVSVGASKEKEQREDENLAKARDSERLPPQSDCFLELPIKWEFWTVTVSKNNDKWVPSSGQLRTKLKPHHICNK